MSEQVTVKFINNEKEYGEAIRTYYSNSKRTKFDDFLGAGVILFALGAWIYYGFSWSWVLCIGVGIFGFALRYLAFYVMPAVRFRQEPKFKDEYILTFSDEGLEFKTEHLNSKLDWNYYYKALESKNFYLLFYGKQLFTIVPKRAFNDEEHERKFKDIISKNLREGIKVI